MARWPYQYTNINGIPAIQSRGVKVTADNVTFSFRPDWDRNPFRGVILVNIADEIPEGTTTTLPIMFTMAGNTMNVTTAGGDNLTVADFSGTGVYLVYYDRLSNVLQLI
jgi:hypothetical protein